MTGALRPAVETRERVGGLSAGRREGEGGGLEKRLTDLSRQPSVQSQPTRKSSLVLIKTPSSGMRSLPWREERKKRLFADGGVGGYLSDI